MSARSYVWIMAPTWTTPVVTSLLRQADAAGIRLRIGTGSRVVDEGALIDGDLERADLVLICAGSWAPILLPELEHCLRAVN